MGARGHDDYYRTGVGRVVLASPWTYLDYWRRTLEFRPEEYEADPLPVGEAG